MSVFSCQFLAVNNKLELDYPYPDDMLRILLNKITISFILYELLNIV